MLSRSIPSAFAKLSQNLGRSAQVKGCSTVPVARLFSTLVSSGAVDGVDATANRKDHKAVNNTPKKQYASTAVNGGFSALPPANGQPLSDQDVLEMKMSNITKAIDSFVRNRFHTPGAVDALHKARMGNLKLEVQHLSNGILACGLSNRDLRTFDLAYWAFNSLKADSVATIENFEAMMNICSKYGRVDSAADLMRDYFARGFTYTSYLLSTYIIIIANNGTPEEVQDLLQPLYTTYKNLSKQRGFKISPRVFMAVAECHCKMRNSEGALTVLRDLTEINHEPSAALCEGLLDCALATGDTAVLRVLLSWYKTNFNVALINGQSRRILHIAAGEGDGQLALMGFQMLRDANFEPTSSDYCCLLRALLLSKDLASVTEVLQEMARQGVSFSNTLTAADGSSSVEFHAKQYAQLRSLLVDAIAGNKQDRWVRTEGQLEEGRAMLDGFYHALVEQVRSASVERSASAHPVDGEHSFPPVPRLILDAVVEAAGVVYLPDRAFAVFQEYQSLFLTKPDVHSYNALLAACTAQRKLNISAIFSVFQEMEASPEGIKPNEESFSILLHAMSVCKSFDIFEQVMEHMLSHSVLASRTALTNAAVALARSGEHWREVELVKQLLIAQRVGLSPGTLSPLSSLKETLELAEKADKRRNKIALYGSISYLEKRLSDVRADQAKEQPRGYY